MKHRNMSIGGVLAVLALAATVAGAADWKQLDREYRQLLAREKWAEARAVFQEMLKTPEAEKSENARREIYNRIAMTCIREGNADEAEKALAKGAELTGRIHINAIGTGDILAAEILLLRKDYDGAIAGVRKVQANKYLGEMFKMQAELVAGKAFAAQGKDDEAKAAFEKILKAKKNFSEVRKSAEAALKELNR